MHVCLIIFSYVSRYLYEFKNNKLSVGCKIKHCTQVFGVGFSPFHSDLLAVGDNNGSLITFTLSDSFYFREGKTFKSHSKPNIYFSSPFQGKSGKIFTLAWNPLVKNIIATAGDDSLVKIWHA